MRVVLRAVRATLRAWTGGRDVFGRTREAVRAVVAIADVIDSRASTP